MKESGAIPMGQKWAGAARADNPTNSEVLKFTELAGRGGMGDKTYRKSGSEAIQLPENQMDCIRRRKCNPCCDEQQHTSYSIQIWVFLTGNHGRRFIFSQKSFAGTAPSTTPKSGSCKPAQTAANRVPPTLSGRKCFCKSNSCRRAFRQPRRCI